ncbi:BNR repeat-containing protein [Rheinheimera sp. UJ51]|uniref:BNR-4 repeat-containing protein n=1 Tax=unclassified Rheinheimera TaxID=115860 RepID=UPI001E3108BD|nr:MULTISPECIES: BNR-4 repeat-containing protein [unclassified Rheinheimera]MCC5453272.1 BNR repeat-containing protein [Rheinheimera sp. UJ51]MCF4010954.1 BNR repeat-containing protein [Rheinheimera sp. UJ63]
MTRMIYVSFTILLSLLLGGCSVEGGDKSQPQMVDYFADNGTGNPLAVVQQPAGEYHNGITYVSYQGPFEDPYIAAYNHEAQSWLGPFRAGTSDLGRRVGRTKFDNHGKPTLLIDDLGYIHIFYGGHGGDKHHGVNTLGDVHHGANKHSISKRPLDITEWEAVDNISVFGTYNQAIKMDNGDIYLFYRHGAHRSDWVYQKSTDHGRTFQPPVSFLKHKRRTDVKAVDSWYAWVTRGEGNELIISFDYHLCLDHDAGIDSRGHVPRRHDVHFMVFNTETDEWRTVDNQPLNIPLTREEAEQKTLVMDTGDMWTFNGSTHLDNKGNPHVSINMGKDIGEKAGGPKLTYHLRWDGNEWLGGSPVNGQKSGISRGDFEVTDPNTIRFIISDSDGKDGVVAEWLSRDGGDSFIKTRELLRRKNSTFATTAMIKNAHPDAQVIVGQIARDTADRKIFLLGQKGPIQRPLKDATLPKDTSTFVSK